MLPENSKGDTMPRIELARGQTRWVNLDGPYDISWRTKS